MSGAPDIRAIIAETRRRHADPAVTRSDLAFVRDGWVVVPVAVPHDHANALALCDAVEGSAEVLRIVEQDRQRVCHDLAVATVEITRLSVGLARMRRFLHDEMEHAEDCHAAVHGECGADIVGEWSCTERLSREDCESGSECGCGLTKIRATMAALDLDKTLPAEITVVMRERAAAWKSAEHARRCEAITGAEAKTLRERVDELSLENKRYREREEHFASALSVAESGQYRNDWDGAIRRVLGDRDALIAALREYAQECRMSMACDARVTRYSEGGGFLRGCDACTKARPEVEWADLPHAAAIRLLGSAR